MALVLSSSTAAHGAEIVLEPSAVQKLVVESLFKDNGRFYIQRGACSAFLDNPAVTLTAGRVVIRSHLSARVGMDFEEFKKAAAATIPVNRTGKPEDIAAAASFFCSEESGFVSGQVLYVAGGPRN